MMISHSTQQALRKRSRRLKTALGSMGALVILQQPVNDGHAGHAENALAENASDV